MMDCTHVQSINIPSPFMLQNRDKLRPDGSLDSYADSTLPASANHNKVIFAVIIEELSFDVVLF